MSKKDLDPRRYSERKHENGSIKEVVYNYKMAFDYWMVFRTEKRERVFSVYMCKQIIAFISLFLGMILIFFCLDALNGRPISNQLITHIINLIFNNSIISTEIIILMFVSQYRVWIDAAVGDHIEGEAVIYYRVLRSISSERPNFLLNDSIVDNLNKETIDSYISALSSRREFARNEMNKKKERITEFEILSSRI